MNLLPFITSASVFMLRSNAGASIFFSDGERRGAGVRTILILRRARSHIYVVTILQDFVQVMNYVFLVAFSCII